MAPVANVATRVSRSSSPRLPVTRLARLAMLASRSAASALAWSEPSESCALPSSGGAPVIQIPALIGLLDCKGGACVRTSASSDYNGAADYPVVLRADHYRPGRVDW